MGNRIEPPGRLNQSGLQTGFHLRQIAALNGNTQGVHRKAQGAPGVLLRRSILVLLTACIVAFYAWDAAPGGTLFSAINANNAYYNMLIGGFRSGHLSLGVDPSPELIKARDPYDPVTAERFGIPDVSYYKGKYYLYFGVAPALFLYWPFEAVTGKLLDDTQAVFLFCTAAFAAGSLLLIRIRQRYFPAFGTTADCGALLAMGLAAMAPDLLRRTQVYEVAISSAYVFFVLSLFCLYQSLNAARRLAWLAGASLCYGLAIASRPTYAFGAACLLVPVWLSDQPHEPFDGRGGRSFLARACAAVIPVGLVVAGLLLYNGLRFGNPLEFGQDLTVSGVREMGRTHFSLSYVWFDCRAYLFAPANLSPYFPFVRMPSLPPPPRGHLGFEDPYGIFPNIPFVLFAFFAPLAGKGRPKIWVFVLSVAIALLAVAAVVFSFEFASNRYMVDFVPGIVIPAVIGSWALLSRLSGATRGLAGAACAVLLGWSAFFNVFAAFGHNELLRLNNPESFGRLAHAFGYPRYFMDKLRGRSYGPLELTVRLPKFEKARLEPLLISGSEVLTDYLYLFYLPDNRIVLGSEHTGHGGPVTRPFALDYGGTHRVTVDMAPLYPPSDDPYFDNLPAAAKEASGGRLRVSIDGAVVMDSPQAFYPAFTEEPSIGGGTENQAALGRRFTGQILGVRRLSPGWEAPANAPAVGPLVMTFEFPLGRTGIHEPLVTSGSTGKGDVLVVGYVDSSHVTFALDHWGYGGPVSKSVEYIPGDLQILQVSFGSFFPQTRRPAGVSESVWTDAAGRLTVILNGQVVIEARTPFYAASPNTVVVGSNPIGASSCVPEFSGTVVGYGRQGLVGGK